MVREKRLIKPLAYAAVVFVTLGLTIANETLSQLGLEQNYVMVFSVALVIAALLLSRNLVLIVAVIAGVVMLNLPDPTFLGIRLDRDVLLAFICGLILVPTVYQLVSD